MRKRFPHNVIFNLFFFILSFFILTSLSSQSLFYRIFLYLSNKKRSSYCCSVTQCRHFAIFPVRRQTSIFAIDELNFRVRNGNGWTLIIINTDYYELKFGDPCGNRTHVWGVRGPRLNRLTNGPWRRNKLPIASFAASGKSRSVRCFSFSK